MHKLLIKSFKNPDETRDLPKTHIEVASFEELTIMRVTFQPGWKWSECVRPTAETGTCQVPHINYVITGRLMIAMDDGEQRELKPGDIAVIAPGHDAWVLGNEPCVVLDFAGGKIYGKKQ